MQGRTKIVLVLRHNLPLNHAVNAAVVLGTSAAHLVAGVIGAEGTDASGHTFAGITTIPVPVLVAAPAELSTLLHRSASADGVTSIAFPEVARRARTYPEYLNALATTTDATEDLVAVLLHGPATAVNRATRTLNLLSSDAAPPPARAVDGTNDVVDMPAVLDTSAVNGGLGSAGES